MFTTVCSSSHRSSWEAGASLSVAAFRLELNLLGDLRHARGVVSVVVVDCILYLSLFAVQITQLIACARKLIGATCKCNAQRTRVSGVIIRF